METEPDDDHFEDTPEYRERQHIAQNELVDGLKTSSRDPNVATARASASQNAPSCRCVGKFKGSLSISTINPLVSG